MKNINTKQIVIGIILLIIFGLAIAGQQLYSYKYSAKSYFNDPKVIALCKAAKKGDIEKIDKLLAEGVDINATGKYNWNPLLWLFITGKGHKKTKIGFKYLLKKGANPLQIDTLFHLSVLHLTARYIDPEYLKIVLESRRVSKSDVDLEVEKDDDKTPLLQAMSANRFTNFKMLLDYGANIEWEDKKSLVKYRTPLARASGNFTWRFAYELLKRGVNYNIGLDDPEAKIKISSISSALTLRYWPSVAINYSGVDYRQKCVEFLREKGEEVNPWMPEDEKYVTENGEDILYIQENSQWIKYTDSKKYKSKKTRKGK